MTVGNERRVNDLVILPFDARAGARFTAKLSVTATGVHGDG